MYSRSAWLRVSATAVRVIVWRVWDPDALVSESRLVAVRRARPRGQPDSGARAWVPEANARRADDRM